LGKRREKKLEEAGASEGARFSRGEEVFREKAFVGSRAARQGASKIIFDLRR